MEEIINEIVSALESKKDIKRLEYNNHILATSMRVLGVRAADMRIVLKALKENAKLWSNSEKFELAKELVKQNILECQVMAYEFLAKNEKILLSITEKDLDDLGQNLDNWGSVDAYSIYLIGPAWREGIIDDAKIKNYLKSDDVWQRRIAVVATVPLNSKAQGGKGDPARTLDICKLVVEDYDDMIVKALSWALRELVKQEKNDVQEFIDRYEDVLHKKVMREVTNKIVFGKKNVN